MCEALTLPPSPAQGTRQLRAFVSDACRLQPPADSLRAGPPGVLLNPTCKPSDGTRTRGGPRAVRTSAYRVEVGGGSTQMHHHT